MTPETVLDAIKDKNVIVFDGECVLCSGFFRFVLKRDMQRQFHFMIAQSEAGEALYRHFDLKPNDYDTNLVLIEGKLFEKLHGFFEIVRRLGFPWVLLNGLRVLPDGLLDWLYNRIARNRYALFGRRDVCLVPEAEMKERFIDG